MKQMNSLFFLIKIQRRIFAHTLIEKPLKCDNGEFDESFPTATDTILFAIYISSSSESFSLSAAVRGTVLNAI